MSGSSPSRIQRYPQDGRRQQMNDTGRPSFGERGPQLYFQKELLHPNLYIEENERCRGMQSQPKHSSSFALIETRIFSYMPFHKQGSYVMYIIFWPGGLLTFYDPFLIKVDQSENLFSLEVFFLYISNLCQPQKVLNRVTFSQSKGAVGHNKERTY